MRLMLDNQLPVMISPQVADIVRPVSYSDQGARLRHHHGELFSPVARSALAQGATSFLRMLFRVLLTTSLSSVVLTALQPWLALPNL